MPESVPGSLMPDFLDTAVQFLFMVAAVAWVLAGMGLVFRRGK
jgi:hypothetical protein